MTMRKIRTDKQVLKEFTEREIDIVRRAAYQVWNEIAHDYFEACEGKAIRRREVIEVVCDAGRLEDEIRAAAPRRLMPGDQLRADVAYTARTGQPPPDPIDYRALADRVDKLGMEAYALVKLAFPDAWYG